MLNMGSGDTAITIVIAIYALYRAWAKFCEHRWPKPEGDA